MMPVLGIKCLRCSEISYLILDSTPTAGVWLVKFNSVKILKITMSPL